MKVFNYSLIFQTNAENLQAGKFFPVKFNVKNAAFFYSSNIVEKLSGKEEGVYKVSYLRKSKKYVRKLIYPSLAKYRDSET